MSSLYRIPLTLSLETGALIGGLRQAIDDMLTRMATNPTLLSRHSPLDDEIIHAVESLVCLKPTSAKPPPPIHGVYVNYSLYLELLALYLVYKHTV